MKLKKTKIRRKGREINKYKYTKNITDFLEQILNISPNYASDFYNK